MLALVSRWSLSSRWLVVSQLSLAGGRVPSALVDSQLSLAGTRCTLNAGGLSALSGLQLPLSGGAGVPRGQRGTLSGAHRRECLCNAMQKAPQCLQVDDSKCPNGRMTSSMTDTTMQINPLKRSTNAKTAGTRGSKARRCPRQENDGKTHTKVQAL